MSRIRTNLITNRMANGAPTVSNGLVISGVTTSTTFSGSGASLTNLNGSNIASGTVPVARIGTGTKSTSTFYRGDGTFATVTSTTINNNANNRLITGSGTANTLEGEANLTFDGDNLLIKSSTDGRRISFAGDGTSHYMKYDNTLGGIKLNGYGGIAFETNGTNERLRIGSSGGVGINTSLIRNNRFLNIAAPSQDYTNNSTELMDGGGICLQHTDTLASTGRTYPGIFWSGNTASLGRARAGILGVTASNNDATHITFLTRTAANGTGFYPSDERMRITNTGKVGINSTTPQQTLDVRGSINGGSENQPFLRFHDSHGDQRVTKHYFRCTKGGTSIFDILTVDINTDFHQALIILYYGARIQAVADSNTYPVHKIIGVNRFNGGSIQFDKQVIQQNGNAQTHADIDAVATSSTNYRIRLTFSGTAGGSSFAAGYVEIIGLGPGTDGAFYSLAHSKGITR